MKTKLILIASLLIIFAIIAVFVISKGTDKPLEVITPVVAEKDPVVTETDPVVAVPYTKSPVVTPPPAPPVVTQPPVVTGPVGQTTPVFTTFNAQTTTTQPSTVTTNSKDTVFINGQWSYTEAKNRCQSMGKKLCTNNQICKPNGTIFGQKNNGKFDKMIRTWLGDETRCKAPSVPWKYVGNLADSSCYDGWQFNRCEANRNLKLEAFACCD